ncbi:MAG TPA: hypothetical protein ENO22_13945 [candidate division Zixibacteria bacterium]|nr:hypothetical protein [candidate division Zixibacteria bacterium]
MKFVKTSLLIAMCVCILAGAGWSQSNESDAAKGFGLRAGYGTNPDQFVFGAQAVLGETLGFMRFAPSIDLGFGDDMTTYLFNADFRVLSFSPPGSPASLYAGTGMSVAVLDFSDNGSDTEIGLNILAGLTFPMGSEHEYNLETRFGFGDLPELRILFGIMLGTRSKSSSQTVEIKM